MMLNDRKGSRPQHKISFFFLERTEITTLHSYGWSPRPRAGKIGKMVESSLFWPHLDRHAGDFPTESHTRATGNLFVGLEIPTIDSAGCLLSLRSSLKTQSQTRKTKTLTDSDSDRSRSNACKASPPAQGPLRFHECFVCFWGSPVESYRLIAAPGRASMSRRRARSSDAGEEPSNAEGWKPGDRQSGIGDRSRSHWQERASVNISNRWAPVSTHESRRRWYLARTSAQPRRSLSCNNNVQMTLTEPRNRPKLADAGLRPASAKWGVTSDIFCM